jgi:CspA family cold shock protein
MSRQQGVVKFYNSEKGFGFITPDHGGDDIFVHYTALEMEGFKCLGEDEQVEFTTEYDPVKDKNKATYVTGPHGNPLQGRQKGNNKGGGKGGYKGGKGGDKGYNNSGYGQQRQW